MKLKAKFSLLVIVLMIASGLAVWVSVQTLAERIITEWAERYVEKQARYDKQRVLQPLLREIVLARQLASSPLLLEWLQSPDDIVLEFRALAELERYREAFEDNNYFLGIVGNGRYYYNNAEDEYGNDQLRYVLYPHEPADRWFYDMIAQGKDLNLNVNPDPHLGVTKLWIDVLLRGPDGRVLGVAGTGLNLSRFLNDFVDSGDAGITSLFVNHDGAIQLYRDQALIDFATLGKPEGDQKRLNLMVTPNDLLKLQAAMAEVKMDPQAVASRFVDIKETRYLVGVAYLPDIDWYEITLMDLNQLLPMSRFNPILLIFAGTLLATLLMFHVVLGRVVLGPLQTLDAAMRRFRQGDYRGEPLGVKASGDEVGRLVGEFEQMTAEVFQARSNLEAKVRERTDELNRISQTDPLTGLLNRRGMDERLDEELKRSARENRQLGVIWIDLDLFKEINDVHGHAVGDEALKLVARVLRSVVREYDAASRWGGDEFLLMVRDADRYLIERICERLLRVIRGQSLQTPGGTYLSMTFSIGCHLASRDDLESVLRDADAALYAAKSAGRNCYRFSHPFSEQATAEETTDAAQVRSH